MNAFVEITTSDYSPAFKIATLLGGVVALFVAIKIGQFMVKLFFGVIGLALLGGAAWWLLRTP
jgi:hypothetical protein